MAEGASGGAAQGSANVVGVEAMEKATRLDARGLVTCSDNCSSKFGFGFLDPQVSDCTFLLICPGKICIE